MRNPAFKKHKARKIGLLTVVFLTFSFLYFCHPVFASEINSENVIKLVNETRKAAGLEELKESNELVLAAQDKAWDMIANNYFAHTSPSGASPWHWIEKNGYNYTHAGENLAMNFNQAENQEEAWMKSEKHRQNILNRDYQEIGVAVKQGVIKGQMTTITVQMFGAKAKGVASETPSKPIINQEEAAKIFSRANDLSLNLNPNQPNVKSLLAQYDIPADKAAGVQIQSPQAVLYQNQEVLNKVSWAIAILVLLLVIAINSLTLSRMIKMHKQSASAMTNTAVLVVVLAALVFLKI